MKMKENTNTTIIVLSIVIGIPLLVLVLYTLFTNCEIERELKDKKPLTYKLKAERGRILDCDGNVLAFTDTIYDMHFDCMAYLSYKRDTLSWLSNIDELAPGLAEVLPKRDPAGWFNHINEGRINGNRYLTIASGLSEEQVQKIKTLPMFNLPPYQGGGIIEPRYRRNYPFGSFARRTIGYYKNDTLRFGMEQHFDYLLYGRDGSKVVRYGRYEGRDIHKVDKYVSPQNGYDIVTTLSMDLSSKADSVLRKALLKEKDIESGCLVLMDVKTGAIRAMTNLTKTEDGVFELSNLAIGRVYEPASLSHAMTYAALLSDGYIDSMSSDSIQTNHGHIPGFFGISPDDRIIDYERIHSTNSIAIRDGFAQTSRYVAGSLVNKHYGEKPQKFLEHLIKYCPELDFDLDGLSHNFFTTPCSPAWEERSLPVLSYGYGFSLTPLSILTFYNSIANKGKMMKPYLLEQAIDSQDGRIKKYGPVVLGQIMPPAVADTLSSCLYYVAKNSPNWLSRYSDNGVTGKTGSAYMALPNNSKNGNNAYWDTDGRRQYAATYVGYFPSDAPEYSIICVVFSKLMKGTFYALTVPTHVVMDFVKLMEDD